MSKMKFYLLFGLIIILYSCSENKIHTPSYNLCNKYSVKFLSDSLFQDTLRDKEAIIQSTLYKEEVEKIINNVKLNCKNLKHTTYPFKKFDQVIYYSLGVEFFGKNLNDKEIEQFIELINNPLNFEWGETTFVSDKLIVFKMDTKEIGRLEIMDEWIIKSQPNNILSKYGALTKEGRKKFKALIKKL